MKLMRSENELKLIAKLKSFQAASLHTRKENDKEKTENSKQADSTLFEKMMMMMMFTQQVTRSQGPELCSAIVAKDKT